MKITEIDFSKDGKEYEFIIDGKSCKVMTRNGDLVFVDGKYDVTDDYRLCAILTADYKEVVEPPVDFMTAYMDCKANGHMYTRDSDSYTIKAIMSRFDFNVVFDFVGESVSAFFPDKTMWIKMV